ncbi:hypothetical protein [Nocardia callitridis]|uniref:Uncharacterized protein n=1 Tax=Nocardia callitridis TaxID=648753 RepID=A0ABP9JV69_9NOCA
MTVEVLTVVPEDSPGRGLLRYHNEQSGCTFLVAGPRAQPALWKRYLDGALGVYRHFGVESALRYDAVRDGGSTPLFFTAIDPSGEMVAGVRSQGPYTSVNQVHELSAWQGFAGATDLRLVIANRIPAGVVEAKGAWVARDAPHRSALSAAISRIALHGTRLLGARYGFATVGSFTVERHRASGGRRDAAAPAVPYPDERYQTVPVWWDTRTYRTFAEPSQRQLIRSEQRALGLPPTRRPQPCRRRSFGMRTRHRDG